MKIHKLTDQSGYAITTVLFMIIIMSLVAYAALLQANNGLNLSYKQSYTQMARMASKAAIDYAQEQFNRSPCGIYTGTDEQDLVSNDRYRLTFKSEVIETSDDGLEKTIRGTGSVYLPRLSASAKYVFDIRSEVIRTYALCKTPLDFNPVVWLDASDTTTLKRSGPPSTSIASQSGLGLLDLLVPNDTVEERVSDGGQGLLSWLSGDIEMHTCDALEFTLPLLGCSNNATRYLYNGFVFENIHIPKNANIVSATMQLTGASGDPGGSVSHRLYGIYASSSNPHLSLFSSSGSNQVKSKITNAATRTNAYLDQTTNFVSAGSAVNFDVRDIVQEMVNHTNWNPGGNIGIGAQRQSGSGSRKFCKGNLLLDLTCYTRGPRLSISYATNTVLPSANNDSLIEWQDKSGNANHARFAYGTAPTRRDNQINGQTIVRFNNGTMLSSLTSALASKREMTVLAVVKTDFSSSASNGRFVSGMSSTASNDTTSTSSIIPLLRSATTNGLASIYEGASSSYRTDHTCGMTCSNTPYIYSSIFAINDENSITATLKGNGQIAETKSNLAPSGSPYTYTIDQFYIGGRRNGAGVGATGLDYLHGDYAEIIIYDKALECRQIEALEEYLRAKWAVSGLPYTTQCPTTPIPTL